MRFFILVLLFLFANKANSQIINIEELRIRTRDSTAWHGQIGGNANYSQNKKKVFQAASDGQAEWKRNRNLMLFIGRFRFLSTNGERFLNDGLLHLRYNRRLFNTDWLSSELFGQWQFNRQIEVKQRKLFGVGLRSRLIKQAKFRAYIGIAFMPEHVNYVDKTLLKTFRLSQYFTWTWQPNARILLNSTVYWQPELGFIKTYRWSSENFIALKISKRLSLKSDWSGGFDNNLPEIVPKFYQNFTNGVVWVL
jgi:Protein of unknown function, DUF481